MGDYTSFIKKHFSNPIFLTLISLFILWFGVYWGIHSWDHLEVNQGKKVNLTANQVASLNSLKSDTSLTDSKLVSHINYYLQEFELQKRVTTEDLEQFFIDLSNKPLEKHSYFFLKNEFVLLEVLLWALLGVICNLIYHLSEHIRKNNYDENEVIVYFSKLFYAPIITLIIYLGFNLLGGDSETHPNPTNTIALSYVLGFFSGRLIELLDRLKDVIIPGAGKQENDSKMDQKKENFQKLSEDERKRIIEEWIDIKGGTFKSKFPEVQSYTYGYRNGNPSNEYCLIIEVIEKKPLTEVDIEFPNQINFIDSKSDDYTIPIDIEAVGKNSPELVSDDKYYIGDGVSPKKLGLSCSRKNTSHKGTIGLKVYKEGKPFMLSCFHVLCAPELYNKRLNTYVHSSLNNEIISPGNNDGHQPEVIGRVSEGILNNYVDAAIALLTSTETLNNEYYDGRGFPNGTRILSSEDRKKRIWVRLVGRSSKTKHGRLIDDYRKVVFMDRGYPDGTLSENKFKDVIIIESISKGGDSGATVVDMNNKLIGMVVGGNLKQTFVIPINRILSYLNIDL